MLNNADVAINLKLLKTLWFYQIFDPNEKKIFGCNVYRLTFMAFAIFNECLFSLCLGCFVMCDKGWNNILDLITMFALCMEHYQVIWQMCVFFYHADVVWETFNVARLNFLTIQGCTKNICMLRDERARSIRITNWLTIIICSIGVQWLMYPLINYWFLASLEDHHDQRAETIYNVPFPVNANTHNKYYFVFYSVEFICATFTLYTFVFYDTYILSICRVISCQYEVITCAFKSLGGCEDTVQLHCDEEYEHFLSILSNKIGLDTMVKSYYSVMKYIVLTRVAFMSSIIISIAYIFIMICSSAESVSIINILKFGSTFLFVTLQLFIYCYLLDNINTAMASVNFGIYSCNWTMMNLKFQKLVLHAMRMNDSIRIILKLTPKKIINLQLFVNVMNTCYNVVSVMVKMSKKN